MLEVLVDHARARRRLRRGGDYQRVPLDDVLDHCESQRIDVIALREALDDLTTVNERQSQVVLLRFLFGYTVEEAAERLEVSVSTVEGDWRLARAWLRQRLGETM
jgi:RNA polymerase sigma factor (TIGR02999 family)